MFEFLSPILYLGVNGDKPSGLNVPNNDTSSGSGNNGTGGSGGGGKHIVYILMLLRYILVPPKSLYSEYQVLSSGTIIYTHIHRGR